MVSINKIRKKTFLIVIVIGVAMVAFILGDIFSSGGSFLSQSGRINVAQIEGEEINVKVFEAYVETSYDYIQKQNLAQLPDKELFRQNLWEQFVSEKLIQNFLERTFLKVSPKELVENTVGAFPHPFIQRFFIDPNTKTFNKESLLNVIYSKESNAELASQWGPLEKALKQTLIEEKIVAVFNSALYTTKAEKDFYTEINSKIVKSATVTYSLYKDIPKDAVSVSDNEAQKYYEEYLSSFEVEPSRTLSYVVFDVLPSKEDTAFSFQNVESLSKQFAKAKNDSAFLARIDRRLGFTRFLSSRALALPKEANNVLASLKKGESSETFLAEGTVYSFKVLDKAKKYDSLNINQILIGKKDQTGLDRTDFIDSIGKLLKQSPERFEEIATLHSDDQQTKEKGGLLGWVMEETLSPDISEELFRTKEGEISKYENENFVGFFRVNERKNYTDKYKLAIFSKKIIAGSKTNKFFFNKAQDFLVTFSKEDQKSFEEYAASQNKRPLTARNIDKNEVLVPQIGKAREMVRWAFEGEKDDVSSIFSIDGKYFIAKIAAIQDEEYASFESVSPSIKAKLSIKKQGEYLLQNSSKRKEAKATITDISLSKSRTAVSGYDIEFIGLLMGISKKIEEFIPGKAGIYKIEDIETSKEQAQNPVGSYLIYKPVYPANYWLQAFKKEKKHDIIDNRFTFY